LLATSILALLGGGLVSLRVLRKVEEVARTSREIIGGDFQRRIPVSGTDDEFDRLATSLNAMLDRIQNLMEDVHQVSNDIAHDLRTPISRMRQRIEHALRSAATIDGMRQAMDETLTDVDGVLQTFGALLRIAQIESGSRKSAFAEVDLSLVLQRIADAYEPVAGERGQRLFASVVPGLWVRGDRELLTQLFANLVENAIQHSPTGASITVAAGGRSDSIEVAIEDNGPGIPPPSRQKVFQRFFRLEESRTTPGNGLGLSLVAAIAALHDVAVMLDDNHPGLRVRMGFARLPRPDQVRAVETLASRLDDGKPAAV
jgi:signal transduction histidine kinase